MEDNFDKKREDTPKIVVTRGPYVVHGNVPLVHKTQVVSEYGEPLTWKKDCTYETGEEYALCRCGRSRIKPLCDRTHRECGFDGTETADTRTMAERQEILRGTRIIVKRDSYLCTDSGFCGNRFSSLDQLVMETGDSQVRAQVMAMIERCPSGALSYTLEEGGPDVEPDLPRQVAVTTEILFEGPIDGPLWVTGWIPVERADGKPLETRNRVALCNCGKSQCKPLCDGAHRHPQEV